MNGNYEAKITIVDRVADAASGTFRVALDLPNPDHSLPSGLKCMVQFTGDGTAPLETGAPRTNAVQASAESGTSQL